MISKLEQYLKGNISYFEACSLFVLIAKNKILATNLLKRDTLSNREKLRYEIKKLSSDKNSAPKIELEFIEVKQIEKSITQPKITQSSTTTFLPDSKTSTIESRILEERKTLYLERGHIHGRMHEVSCDDERGELAKRIIEIQPKIDELNRDLRQIENGSIPEKYLKTKATAEEYLELRNAKMYVARYKKELSTASPNDQQRLMRLIKKYEAKLKSL